MAEKPKTIIVNGQQKIVNADELAFDQIVDLAFDPSQRGPQIEFTVDYRKGDEKKPKGSLVQGQTVKIKDGMIFNVTRTDKS